MRRALRALAWSLGGLVAVVLALGAGTWWWLGTNESLAFALARAARYLPAGQTLESRDVAGSLRAGGRIGWLRWQSDTLAVEVHDARIGWQWKPLFQRKVQLGEVHAAQVLIEPRGPQDKPPEPLAPLEPIVLPVEVDLPFRVDELRWAGPPLLKATGLSGHYRYTDARHKLDIAGVDIADGHYRARVDLQGPAPMAIDASLDGRVRAPLAEGHSIDVLAKASIQGQLAGADARLNVQAQLDPAQPDAQAPMQARLQANIAPWQPQPVIDAKAHLKNVDLARLWPGAPVTQLSGDVEAGPEAGAGTGATAATLWNIEADLANARPGPWDTGKLPVEKIQARASFDGTHWILPEATVRAGGGRIDAAGRWSPAPEPWQVDASVRGVRPGELHTEMAGAAVNGSVKAEQRGDALLFDVALQAGGGAGAKALQGLRLDHVLARGKWQSQVLDLRTLRVEAANANIEGQLQLRVEEKAGNGDIRITMPGGNAQVQGRISPSAGAGEVKAQIDDAALLQRWVESLPGQSAAFAGAAVQGNARLDAKWEGGWQAIQRRLQNATQPAARGVTEPTLQATLSAPRLDLRMPPPANGPARSVLFRDLRAELAGSLAQATLSLKGEASTGTQKLTIDTRASGGLEKAHQWKAAIASLHLQAQAQDSMRPGPWTLELGQAVSVSVRTGTDRLEIDASAASATLRGPVPGALQIDWQPLRFLQRGVAPNRAFRLQSKGRMQGLPMAWAEAFGSSAALREVGLSGDLMFDGDWDIDAGDTLRARAGLTRKSGDIRVQAGEAALVTKITSRGTGTASERSMNVADEGLSTPAGLRQAELRIDAEGETVRATLAWDSERAGQIRAEASTRVQQRADGWQWAPDAALAGKVVARLPNLGVWSILAPPGWRIAGTLDANATLSGSRTAPRWNGTLGADKLALRAFVEGLDLRDGRLRANLSGNHVEIAEFTIKGGAGSTTRIPGQSGNISTAASEAARDGGTLSARGELGWGAASPANSGIRMAVQAQLRSLRVLARSDRQVTLSGDLQARLDAGQFTLRGQLKTDRAVIILPDETAPGLGSDVVVRSAARERAAAQAARRRAASDQERVAKAQTAKPPDVSIGFDLGNDFAVQGRGITTRLEGKLDISTRSLSGPPRITGEVKTVKGQYSAYGQQLTVETGLARFNGPFDNPALDILAIRPNIAQRAGVKITGSAQSPRVRLYSEPTLSDAETLSWLVLGRASASSGGESLLLQQAALALLGGLGKGGSGGGLASRFGLDEIGFKGPSDGDVRGAAVTLGKRISKDFYVTYERSLAGTLGSLFIFYDLTRRLTLRGQAGQQSGMDLIYTLQFD